MISSQENHIKEIINDLENYKGRSHEQILKEAISARLDKSLKEYYNDLIKAFNKLAERSENNSIGMLKKLNKE